MQHCRDAFADNTEQLNSIKKVEHTYHDKTPIWWYSCQCFLFPMLNSALRHMNIDVIIKIGFFMKDLHRRIEELQKKHFRDDKSNTTFIVYRGQGLSKQDFEKMRQIKGGLIAFNNFLSTSKDPEVSRAFAESNKDNRDLVGVFFVITIDPAKSTTPLASIKDVSYFPDEDEVLFAMNSIFRIGDITSMDENLFQVDLTLTNDDDRDLRILTDCIQKGTYPEAEGWYRLGMVLMRLVQPEQTRQVYEVLLEQATNEGDKAYFYNNLGWTKFNQGEHEDGIKLYEKSLEIYKRTHSPTDPDVAWPYNNIGAVYNKMREYSKALSFYEAALAIRQQSLPPNHPDLAYTYHHIGSVYNKMQECSKALSFYETALTMRQQSLPPNHPELAASYNHIGWEYKNMGDYSKTLLCYEKSLAIRQQSLPPDHPDLAKSYDNLGRMYRKMGDYSKALSLYEKSLVIKQQLSPPNYYNLAASYNNIGELYENMNEYPKALTFFERAVDIAQKILPSNHPNLLKWQKDLENITDKYDKITITMHSDLVQDLIR